MTEAETPTTHRVLHGNALDELKTLPDASVDSVVTDPPYEIGFMENGWDSSGIAYSVDLWREVYRVLKPGGHLLSFGATRTYHRMAVAIEDAGFTIRDSLAWIYGSGFPKSMDVARQLDKQDAVAANRARALRFTAWLAATGITPAQLNRATGTDMGGHYLSQKSQPQIPVDHYWRQILPLLGGIEVPGWVTEYVAQRTVESEHTKARAVVGQHDRPVLRGITGVAPAGDLPGKAKTTAHTPDAKQWTGWGTALKPAQEPIVLARKPMAPADTVATNVLKYGTGALNIDASRIPINGETPKGSGAAKNKTAAYGDFAGNGGNATPDAGRFPANVLLDEVAAGLLDEQAQSAKSEAGGPSRFFYVAKPKGDERPRGKDGTLHPTVKPIALMEYLITLITPPGGTVLDPFAGSGTTLEAAKRRGFSSVGVEMTEDYLELIEFRLNRASEYLAAPQPVKKATSARVSPVKSAGKQSTQVPLFETEAGA